MARTKKPAADNLPVGDYRHAAKRKNNPPARIAAEGAVPLAPKAVYEYSPRRPPALRFDPDGEPDKLPELLAIARERKLNDDEIQLLADYLARTPEDDENLRWIENAEGTRKRILEVDRLLKAASEGGRVFRPNPLTSQSGSETTQFKYEFQSSTFSPAKGGWKTNLTGMQRLDK